MSAPARGARLEVGDVLGYLLADVHDAALEVDVGPAQPEQLAAAEPVSTASSMSAPMRSVPATSSRCPICSGSSGRTDTDGTVQQAGRGERCHHGLRTQRRLC